MSQGERHGAQTTESSTIISIGELMQMEHHRIDEEKQRQAKRHRDHESAIRTARARRERELEEQNKAAEQMRRVREQAEMEEAAALAGKMLGFITRAKVHAESEARETARSQEHKRAVELERAKVDARRGVLRWAIAAVSISAALTIAGLLGSYAGIIAPERERQVASLQSEVVTANDKIDRIERDLARERTEKTQVETDRSVLSGKLAAASQQIDKLTEELSKKRPGPRPGVVVTDPPPETGAPCLSTDPLCPLSGRM